MPWLPNYTKRRKITIDSNKVDSDLTDFPVMIHLASGTGILNQDVSDVFDEFSYHTGKEFTGNQISISPGAEGTYDTQRAGYPFVMVSGTTYQMWYSGYNGSNWRIIYCDSTDGVNWDNHQMVISSGAEGTYDTRNSYYPFVMLENGTYKMWYSGYDNSHVRIIYCDSTDGKNWANHQLVVDYNSEGNYDTTHAYKASVIKDGSVYKMWYGGLDGSNNGNIIYCTSNDGTTWSSFQRVVARGSEGTYDILRAYNPHVIKEENIYKMWYTGNISGNYERLIYCDSTDGINWSNFVVSVDLNTIGTYDDARVSVPSVLKENNIYKIWYDVYDGSQNRVAYAYSQDDGGYDYRKKIAITGSDGITEQYVEIENWDSVNRKAFLWTKCPTVSSGTDTDMYLYYGRNVDDNYKYVGDTGEIVAQKVWDDDFKCVYHLAQDPTGTVYDSTSNAINLSSTGSMTSSDLVDGYVGKGIEFDGSNDKLTSSTKDFSDLSSECTLEARVKWLSSNSNYDRVLHIGPDSNGSLMILAYAATAYYSVGVWGDDVQSDVPLDIGNYTYRVLTKSTGNLAEIYDGYTKSSYTNSVTVGNLSSTIINLGCNPADTQNSANIIIDEIRVSKIKRSDDYIKVNYFSTIDNLLTFGSEQSGPAVYSFGGYVKQYGDPVSRIVRLYKTDTGELMDEATSNATTGYYYLTTTYSGTHYIICLDDPAIPDFSHLVIKNAVPSDLA